MVFASASNKTVPSCREFIYKCMENYDNLKWNTYHIINSKPYNKIIKTVRNGIHKLTIYVWYSRFIILVVFKYYTPIMVIMSFFS